MWKTSANVIRFVVGALGAVASLDKYEDARYRAKEVDRIQFSALLGSTSILRKVLDISG